MNLKSHPWQIGRSDHFCALCGKAKDNDLHRGFEEYCFVCGGIVAFYHVLETGPNENMTLKCCASHYDAAKKLYVPWREAEEKRSRIMDEIKFSTSGQELFRANKDNNFIVKDSGERQSFASGMVRDTQAGKTDFSRILDGPMVERWAVHLTKGAVKYPDVKPGVANWTLANGEEELVRFKKSALRHFLQWYRGDVDEDHAAAVFFNINGKEYVQAKLK